MTDAYAMVAQCAERQWAYDLLGQCACGERILGGRALCATCAARADAGQRDGATDAMNMTGGGGYDSSAT